MLRILSTSYNDTLLRAREWILEREGYDVFSAMGFDEAREACSQAGFQLLIMGHSIPKADKEHLIACFRASNPYAPVVALIRAGEPRLPGVDTYVHPGDPDALTHILRTILTGIRPLK